MSLSFARSDITQTSQAERGTLTVLPLGKINVKHKIWRHRRSDSSAVLQEEERYPPSDVAIESAGDEPGHGGAPEQQDNLRTGQVVKESTKRRERAKQRGTRHEACAKKGARGEGSKVLMRTERMKTE